MDATMFKETVDDWQRKETLGNGTFGRVTLWIHKTTGEAIAVKECCSALDQRRKIRWKEEIEMLTQIKHPNLIGVRDLPPSLLKLLKSTEPCLGMEHCEGGDLRKVLNQPVNCTGLKEFAVLNVLNNVLNAVKFLHLHKIIHRDLKPENILVSFIGEEVVYKVTDLGYAKQLDQSSFANSFVGTMKYVAPEVFSSKEGYTFTADFWSLGNIIFECITGRRPFDLKNSLLEWHAVVSGKSSNDICGYEVAGEVKFQQIIPKPYKLSSPLIPMFESWLRLVMEWDPKIRGGEKDQNGDRLCYRIAEKILCTKVVHVFCVNICKLFSFKINEGSTVDFLEEQLSNHLNAHDCILLLADGSILHSDRQLHDFFNQRGDSEWVIYAINANSLAEVLKSRKGSIAGQLGLQNIYQELPENIRSMVEKQDQRRPPSELKRLWGCSLHYIAELAKKYHRLLEAQRSFMITLMRCNAELMQKKEEMIAEAYKLAANIELFLDSCRYDLKYFHQTSFSKNAANKIYAEELNRMIEETKTYNVNLIDEVKNRVTIAQRELINLKNSPLVRNQDSELDEISKLAKEQYEKLLKTLKSNPEPQDSQYMSQLILQVLSAWERLESEFYRQLGKVVNCKYDMEKLIPEMSEVILKLRKYRENIHQSMKRKQEATWKTLEFGSDSPASLSSSPYASMTNALTSIIEETNKEPLDPKSLIEKNKDGLERLGEIVEEFKTFSGKGRNLVDFDRRQSATNVTKTSDDKLFANLSKRRTVSDLSSNTSANDT